MRYASHSIAFGDFLMGIHPKDGLVPVAKLSGDRLSHCHKWQEELKDLSPIGILTVG